MTLTDVLFLITSIYSGTLLTALTMRVWDRIVFRQGMRKAHEEFEQDKKVLQETLKAQAGFHVVPFPLSRQRKAN